MVDVPGGLEPGEQPLRWLVPSANDWIPALRWSRGPFLLVVVGGLFLSLMCGLPLGVVFPPLGAVVVVAGGVASLVGGAVVLARAARNRPRWWVTTRRLVVHVGAEEHDLRIGDLTELDVSAQGDALTVAVGEDQHTVRGINALGELWGALAFARVWAPGPLELGEVSVDENAFRWADVKDGLTVVRGVLVLRPDTVAWVPERTVRSGGRIAADLGALAVGARIHRVQAVPPLGQVAWLLMRLTEPARVDAEVERVASAWGGWCTTPGQVSWSVGGEGGLRSRWSTAA